MRQRLLASVLGPVRRWRVQRTPGHRQEKAQRAAGFFEQHLRTLSVSHTDALVRRVWMEYRGWPRIQACTQLSLSDPSIVAVDIAGGLTSILRLFASKRRAVLDLCVGELRQRGMPWPDCPFLEGDAHTLPFASDSVDVVFCTNALDHFETPSRVIAEVARVLKPAGHLVLAVDVFESEYDRRPGLLHPHAFTTATVDRLLRGWRIVDHFLPSPAGKVGFGQLASGNDTPNPKKQELIWVAAPPRCPSLGG